MKADCTWSINGVAGHSTISDVLRPWPELRAKALQDANPVDYDDPSGDCSFGVDVAYIAIAARILILFIKAGAGYHLSLFVQIHTPFGPVDAALCADCATAQVYPTEHDAKITETAMLARNLLNKALDDHIPDAGKKVHGVK